MLNLPPQLISIYIDYIKPTILYNQHLVYLSKSKCPLYRIENFVNNDKNFLKNRNWTFRVVHYFARRPLSFCEILSLETFFASNLLQTPSNLICSLILVTLSPLTQFWPKNDATNLQKKRLNLSYLIIAFLIFLRRSTFGKFGLGRFFRKIQPK